MRYNQTHPPNQTKSKKIYLAQCLIKTKEMISGGHQYHKIQCILNMDAKLHFQKTEPNSKEHSFLVHPKGEPLEWSWLTSVVDPSVRPFRTICIKCSRPLILHRFFWYLAVSFYRYLCPGQSIFHFLSNNKPKLSTTRVEFTFHTKSPKPQQHYFDSSFDLFLSLLIT